MKEKSTLKKPANLKRGGWLALFIVCAALVAFYSFTSIQKLASEFTVANLPGMAIVASPTPALDAQGQPLPETPAAPQSSQDLGPAGQPWDGASRVTMLVVGLDYADWSADREGPSRTDTMILFTIDPLAKTAGILNIPRDLWVSIPGFEYGKINTAYYLGEAYQVPGGGPELATQAVENLLGVQIDYFAQIDFHVFERLIDEIGGVVVNVQAEMKIDPIGQYNTKILQPGEQRLYGADALAYVRARYTESGDFDRAARQQEVIMEVIRRVTKPTFFPTLVSKAPALYTELAPGVRTNMSLDTALQFVWFAKGLFDEGFTKEDIRRGAIAPPDQLSFSKSPDGTLDILVPVPDKIRQMRDFVFSMDEAVSPLAAQAGSQDLMRQEAARLSVLNGSGVEGLATRTQTYLVDLGANVPNVGNGQYSQSTRIVSYTGKPYTLRYLVELMGISQNQIYLRYDPAAAVDVEILLGADWANTNTLP
jgi:LCP family protein required for cell wall assembly